MGDNGCDWSKRFTENLIRRVRSVSLKSPGTNTKYVTIRGGSVPSGGRQECGSVAIRWIEGVPTSGPVGALYPAEDVKNRSKTRADKGLTGFSASRRLTHSGAGPIGRPVGVLRRKCARLQPIYKLRITPCSPKLLTETAMYRIAFPGLPVVLPRGCVKRAGLTRNRVAAEANICALFLLV